MGACAHDICVLNVNINSTSVNHAQVNPGAAVTVSFDYTTIGTGTYCPTCIQQFYVGFSPEAVTGTAPGTPANCFISTTFMDTARTGNTGSLSLTAPSTPGIYYLAIDSTLLFSCPSPAGGLPSGTHTRGEFVYRGYCGL
jgi:hypothetical protein